MKDGPVTKMFDRCQQPVTTAVEAGRASPRTTAGGAPDAKARWCRVGSRILRECPVTPGGWACVHCLPASGDEGGHGPAPPLRCSSRGPAHAGPQGCGLPAPRASPSSQPRSFLSEDAAAVFEASPLAKRRLAHIVPRTISAMSTIRTTRFSNLGSRMRSFK
jgi:hypothetical protein